MWSACGVAASVPGKGLSSLLDPSGQRASPTEGAAATGINDSCLPGVDADQPKTTYHDGRNEVRQSSEESASWWGLAHEPAAPLRGFCVGGPGAQLRSIAVADAVFETAVEYDSHESSPCSWPAQLSSSHRHQRSLVLKQSLSQAHRLL